MKCAVTKFGMAMLGAAVALQLCARALNRYGRSGDPAAS